MLFVFLLSFFLLHVGCPTDALLNFIGNVDYRQQMRVFIAEIANYAKARHTNFLVIPQNGLELLTDSGEPDQGLNQTYLPAIDGIGFEELYYGINNKDNRATPTADINYNLPYLKLFREQAKKVLVIDYCKTPAKVDDSYQRNDKNGFISFAAPNRELELIPTYPQPIYHENSNNITTLAQTQNFLYIINASHFRTNAEFLNAIRATNYDLIVLDSFIDCDSEPVMLTPNEVASLKIKANGGRRLVVSYMCIGEAEDYRWYWNPDWTTADDKLSSTAPAWLSELNPDWEGNFKVKYWYPSWKKIIYGTPDAYLDRILAAGFDGVYLDMVDAYYYFEEQE